MVKLFITESLIYVTNIDVNVLKNRYLFIGKHFFVKQIMIFLVAAPRCFTCISFDENIRIKSILYVNLGDKSSMCQSSTKSVQ